MSVVPIKSTVSICSQMVTWYTRNGLRVLNPSQFLVSLITGIERNSELEKTITDASILQFQLSMENAGCHIIPNTRFALKDQMDLEEIETLHGLEWLSKIQIHSFMIASGGILKRNLFGPIKDQYLSHIKVCVSMRHMLVWLKNGVKLIFIVILPTTILTESKKQDTM